MAKLWRDLFVLHRRRNGQIRANGPRECARRLRQMQRHLVAAAA